ncbi:MAG: hypothetical protein ACPGPG_12315, partial [Luminiphilus sp.]
MDDGKDKVVVCTGSGRPGGLGEAILQRFAEDGYRVVVSDIDGSEDANRSHLSAEADRTQVAQTLAATTGEEVPVIT